MSLLLLFAAAATSTVGVPIDAGGAPPRNRTVYYQTRSEPIYVAPVVAAATPQGWQSPLWIAPPVAQAFQTSYDLPSVLAQTPQGWQQALSGAPVVKRLLCDTNQPLPFFTPAVVTTSWQGPLSGAPATAKAQPGFAAVPFSQAVTVSVSWQSQLSVAPSVRRAADVAYQLPTYTAPVVIDNTVTIDKWQAPLSIAVPVAKARQGDAFVPYNTVQPVVVYPTGIPLNAGDAPPRKRQVYYQARFDPPYVAPVAVAGIAGMAWFTPLWTVPMRNFVVRPGDSFVPFNTTQQIVITTPGRRRPILFIANVGRLMN